MHVTLWAKWAGLPHFSINRGRSRLTHKRWVCHLTPSSIGVHWYGKGSVQCIGMVKGQCIDGKGSVSALVW